jgi:hypothetical protein
MPTVFRERGFRFFFYSDEGSPLEPIHIHVVRDEAEAKFWLESTVQVAYNRGHDTRTMRELQRLVAANRSRIVRAWNEHFV